MPYSGDGLGSICQHQAQEVQHAPVLRRDRVREEVIPRPARRAGEGGRGGGLPEVHLLQGDDRLLLIAEAGDPAAAPLARQFGGGHGAPGVPDLGVTHLRLPVRPPRCAPPHTGRGRATWRPCSQSQRCLLF